MPLKRQEVSIPFNYSAIQLLAYLAVDGYLSGVSVPDWADGTSVSELMEALEVLGDGEWLEKFYPDYSQQDAADKWLSAWAHGETVPEPHDEPDDDDEDDEEDDSGSDVENDDVEGALSEIIAAYLDSIDASRKPAVNKMIESNPAFLEETKSVVVIAAQWPGESALQDDEDEYIESSNQHKEVLNTVQFPENLEILLMMFDESSRQISAAFGEVMDKKRFASRMKVNVKEVTRLSKKLSKK